MGVFRAPSRASLGALGLSLTVLLLLTLSQRSVNEPSVLEEEDGATAAVSSFSVSTSLGAPHQLQVRHYSDPQALPDASLVQQTVNEDAVAISKIKKMVAKISELKDVAAQTSRGWEHQLKAAEDVDWTALDLASDKDHVVKQVSDKDHVVQQRGIPGAAGDPGPEGPPGVGGIPGPTLVGALGFPGVVGSPGAPGAAGQDGGDGLAGVRGVTGAKGADGAPGPDGVEGDAGRIGSPGVDGPTGKKGPPGMAGLRGASGKMGRNGMPGVHGDPGERGERGEEGVVAPLDVSGLKGLAGALQGGVERRGVLGRR